MRVYLIHIRDLHTDCLIIKYYRHPDTLFNWYSSRARASTPSQGFDLLRSLLTYDPVKRLTAKNALSHKWWSESPKPHSK